MAAVRIHESRCSLAAHWPWSRTCRRAALARAAAQDKKKPLYAYLAKMAKTKHVNFPLPMCNILNGGSHSDAPIDIQEFMVAPVGAKSFSKGLQMST